MRQVRVWEPVSHDIGSRDASPHSPIINSKNPAKIEGQVKYFYLDLDRKVAEFAPGIEIPLRPFPGTTGVARAEPGQYSSVPPGRYAGNIDVRDFVEGTALYVPIFVKGALL